MKIVFLCGCLEAGRDGVGDYVRRLSTEIIRSGHVVAAIALNDQKINEEIIEDQIEEGIPVPMLRLPSIWSYQKRFTKVKQYIDAFGPDCLSLQYVPYSFHSKGLPFEFHNHLYRLKGTYRWHIMFHEIWIGATGFKQRVISWWQQYLIYNCVSKLRPSAVNVSIAINQLRLRRLGIQSNLLNLFGNIPVGVPPKLPAAFTNLPSDCCKILYFGGPPKTYFFKQVIDGISSFCAETNLPVAIIVISPQNKEKDIFIQASQLAIEKGRDSVIDYGFADPDILSFFMSYCDVGITRADPAFLGKSGSAIALLEHGLPVWMPKWISDEQEPEFPFRKELVFKDLSEAVKMKKRPPYMPLLPETAKEFIKQLNF